MKEMKREVRAFSKTGSSLSLRLHVEHHLRESPRLVRELWFG